jgi:hypothetical protein
LGDNETGVREAIKTGGEEVITTGLRDVNNPRVT